MGQDVSEASGHLRFEDHGRRKSSGSFDPEMTTVANQDYFGIQRAGTVGSIATGVIGGTAGNRLGADHRKVFDATHLDAEQKRYPSAVDPVRRQLSRYPCRRNGPGHQSGVHLDGGRR